MSQLNIVWIHIKQREVLQCAKRSTNLKQYK
jgi:hypothetical protein